MIFRGWKIVLGVMAVLLFTVTIAQKEAAAQKAAATAGKVAYPAGYRNWVHVKSMAILDSKHPLFGSFGGLHHIYVNPPRRGLAAMKAGAGRHFPDGTVIVFDLLEAKQEGGALTEGKRKLLGVIVKNSKQYPETGGWGFEGFAEGAADKRLVDPSKGGAKTQCFSCHMGQAKQDCVFSTYRP